MQFEIALTFICTLWGAAKSSIDVEGNNIFGNYNYDITEQRGHHIGNTLPGASYKKGEEDFYSYFVKEAPKHPADYDSDHSRESIPWFDENLFLQGQKFYDRNFIGIAMCTLYSGIELFAIKSTTSVLMISGTVSSRTNAYKRILRTVDHMISIETSGMDIFRKGTPSYNSLETIRRKHRYASHIATNRSQAAIEYLDQNKIEPVGTWKEMSDLVEALREDLAFVDTSEAPIQLLHWDSNTPVGQFDLGVVQFIIFCHIAMSPKAFGVDLVNPEDIQAYVHGSALVGRILGIQDRFNVALNLPATMYKTFYKNIVVASLKNVEEPVLHVMRVTMEGMSNNFIVPDFLKLKCWLHYSLLHSVDGYEGKNILKLMDFADNVCLSLLDIGTGSLNYSRLYGRLARRLFTSWFQDQKRKFNITTYV